MKLTRFILLLLLFTCEVRPAHAASPGREQAIKKRSSECMKDRAFKRRSRRAQILDFRRCMNEVRFEPKKRNRGKPARAGSKVKSSVTGPRKKSPPYLPPGESPPDGSSSRVPGERSAWQVALDLWKAQMTGFGRLHCDALFDEKRSFDEKLSRTHYDAALVFYQIEAFSSDSSWGECAEEALRIYRDDYVLSHNGNVPGYWSFTGGLTEDYLRSRDAVSRDAVLLLAHSAAFASDLTPIEATESSAYSLEVAYTILTYLNAERLGASPRLRLAALVDQALRHIDQWVVRRDAPFVRPSAVAQTIEALIRYNEAHPDPRVLPAAKAALDYLWANLWIESAGAFAYTDRNGPLTPAPDLNLLIAPAYAWVYRQTGDTRYLESGDKIFINGVNEAWLHNGRQFNQNYRWSFDYVKWRNWIPAP